MIRELDRVVLMTDLPAQGLKSGDPGTVVLVHRDERGYEVEFVTLAGEDGGCRFALPDLTSAHWTAGNCSSAGFGMTM